MEEKYRRLYELMEEYTRDNVAVAFSGGVDSSLLLKLAVVCARERKSRVIPFSAVEMALASASGTVGRAEAVRELKEHSGFTPGPPAEWAEMLAYFQEKDV